VSNRFVYTPAVQRVLQLAANIYDATTNQAGVSGKDFPSVFRPVFQCGERFFYTNVFISGYTNMINNFIQSGSETNPVATPDLVLPVEVTALRSAEYAD